MLDGRVQLQDEAKSDSLRPVFRHSSRASLQADCCPHHAPIPRKSALDVADCSLRSLLPRHSVLPEDVSVVTTSSLSVHALTFVGLVVACRSVLAVWDCSINTDGLYYLDAQPAIQCYTEEGGYPEIRLLSHFGLSVYLFTLAVVLKGVFGLQFCACRDAAAQRRRRKAGERVRLKGVTRCLCGLFVFDFEKGACDFSFALTNSI